MWCCCGGGKCVAQPPAEACTTPVGIDAQVTPGLLHATKEVEGQTADAAGESQLMLRAPGTSTGNARCDPTCATCTPGMSTCKFPCEATDAKRAMGTSIEVEVPVARCQLPGASGVSGVSREVPVARIVLRHKRLSVRWHACSCGFGSSCSRRHSTLA